MRQFDQGILIENSQTIARSGGRGVEDAANILERIAEFPAVISSRNLPELRLLGQVSFGNKTMIEQG
jgi:hypothetical protein